MSDIFDFIGHSVEGMAVWRLQSRLETGLEIFFYALSFFFVTAILVALVWWLV